jgi:mannan endo-1,4-beta-mannosidase
MHSFNALNKPDVYGALYGTGYFYEWANATSQFDNRIKHILNHEHSTLGKPWKALSDYIFAFEAENEAMIGKVIDGPLGSLKYCIPFDRFMIIGLRLHC